MCHLKFGSLFGADNSEPKIIFSIFFSIFLSIFWCNLKVGSSFVSGNSEPKIFFDLFFENVMSNSIFELEKYEGSIVGSVEDVDC